MTRVLQWLTRFGTILGFLVILITVTPALRWWTSALSTNWGPDDGDVLVILGSGLIETETLGHSSYLRSYYGAVTWKDRHFKRAIVSGRNAAPLMADFLATHGVPREAINEENESDSTHENAVNVTRMLGNSPGRVVLVTSDYHMGRALRAFRAGGIDASPLPYPDVNQRLNHWPERCSVFALLLEETVKTVWYRAKGW
ncbi:MAG TPA: YdcF family protein [Bryobacteraceae bacterium]|nr:YdcF family protein [Bryobacteraceae bacterium]